MMTIEAAYSKNGKTQTIPIHSCLGEPLRVWMESSPSDYLFPGLKGKLKGNIRECWKNACSTAKLRGKPTPHILRHTFASRLAMSGVNSLTLQMLGRWEDPKMLQRHAHLCSVHLAEALEKIQPKSVLVTDFTRQAGGAT